jgi:hypothetical protein
VRYPAVGVQGSTPVWLALAAATACSLLLWGLDGGLHSPGWWLQVLALLLLAAWCLWSSRQRPRGELLWLPDPEGAAGQWRWLSAARPRGVVLQAPRPVLDLGTALLLQTGTPDGMRLWLWCARAPLVADDQHWWALRCAITAHGAPETASGIFRRPRPEP